MARKDPWDWELLLSIVGPTVTVLALLGLVFVLVSTACPARAQQPCMADTARFYPTTTLAWDPVVADDLRGYRVYFRLPPSEVWTILEDLPCQTVPNEDTGGIYSICRGAVPGVDFAVQRQTDQQNVWAHLCVVAVDTAGNESTTCTLADADPDLAGIQPDFCLPDLWEPGTPYD